MIEVLSVNKCKELDRETIEEIKIPSIILMENAAISIFNEIKELGKTFFIVCGKGNNGGDALALARQLILARKEVKVLIVSKKDNYSNDFMINYNILSKMLDRKKIIFISNEADLDKEINSDIKEYDIVIDGLLGVGLNRDVDELLKSTIFSINKYAKKVISIDVPSGLDCDTGLTKGAVVMADCTYTFEVIKKGFLNYNALKFIGKLKVLNIGIPDSVRKEKTESIYFLEENEIIDLIPKRRIYGHKGNYGRALIFAGSKGFTGAAYITTECTVRAGAGLTTLICEKDIQEQLSNKLIEAMTIDYDDERAEAIINQANSIAMGPGIGRGTKPKEVMEYIIRNSKCPIVIDADGIEILAKNNTLFKFLKGRAVITPHPGEMANFLGITINEVESNRVNIAKEVAKKYEIIVLLKGYNTVISDGTNTFINNTGNSKMASGGMGDALTGIINAFLAQGVKIMDATLISAYIHGYIGDELSKESYIVNARDIINNLPKYINKLIK
ncbi:MAG: NAD(P)H-hydrate dehydratase [Clostridium butyricum]|nr:NAD(P)H-hydrate dehydratase [Clostridium butyricum]